MSNIITLQNKFAHRYQVVDQAKAAAAATAGGSDSFLRVKQDAEHATVVRFLPPPPTEGAPLVLGTAGHWVPTESGGSKKIPCLRAWSASCPLCAAHEDALKRVGVEVTSPSGKVRTEYHLPGDKYPNSLQAKPEYIAQVVVQRTSEHGEVSWEGPQPMALQPILMEKIYGLKWKTDTYKARLTAKADGDAHDPFNGYAVTIRGAKAPTFFMVDIVSDRSGAHKRGPIFTGDDAEDRFERLFDGLIDLRTLVPRPDDSLVASAASLVYGKIDESCLATKGELPGEVEDASTVVMAKRQTRSALPAPVEDVVPAAPRRARAAAVAFDEDDI